MKIALATATTINYIDKIMPYLVSINKNSNFDENILVTLDCEYDFSNFNKIKNCFLSSEYISSKNKNNCIQHGEFLKCDIFSNLTDYDYVCFTDGDIVMQRGLNAKEFQTILSLKDNDVLVQYNANEKDSLFEEAKRLKIKLKLDKSFIKYPCYNTGVLVCNIKTWKKLELQYKILFEIIKNECSHYALQQWLISYIISFFMKPVICDYSFHTHHHYGVVEGNHYEDDLIYHKNELVLFAHHIERF